MASRISQIRNGMQPYPQTTQQSLNDSIDRTRALMQQIQGMANPQAAITNLLQSNPQLQSMLQNGMSLENIAKSMASAGGYDINQIINRLTSNT